MRGVMSVLALPEMRRAQGTDRLARLKRLAVEVGQLPPSLGRSRLLREIRGRVVSVDTGAANPSAWGGSDPGGAKRRESDRDDLEHDLKRVR